MLRNNKKKNNFPNNKNEIKSIAEEIVGNIIKIHKCVYLIHHPKNSDIFSNALLIYL